jgi:hypothetical protein
MVTWSRSLCREVVLVACLTLAAPSCLARQIRVPDDSATIAGALTAAASGDTVLVSCGTYYEHDLEMKSGVRLISETGDSDCATIDALRHGRVMYCDGLESGSLVRGFTLANGRLTSESPGGGDGGAIYCVDSSVEFDDIRVQDCSAAIWYGAGGGIACHGSPAGFSDVEVRSCSATFGGGAYFEGPASSTLSRCEFVECHADSSGGGASFMSACTACLTDCSFIDNTSTHSGGAECHSSVQFVDCRLCGNAAARSGGALVCNSAAPRFESCLFSSNVSGWGGAALRSFNAEPTLVHCTFYGNSGSEGAGVSLISDSHAELQNVIIAFSLSGDAVHCSSGCTASLVCTDLYGNAGGDWVGCVSSQSGVNENLCADPLFCDPPSEDFSIDIASPCAEAASPTCGLIGAYGVACNLSPVLDSSWTSVKALFR